MSYLEASDHPELFVPHGFEKHLVDLGEVRLTYATAGGPDRPALLLIPAQTESWWSYEAAIHLLLPPDSNPHPETVAGEITRILRLPHGEKPYRSVVDFTQSHVGVVNDAAHAESIDFLTRMGYQVLPSPRSFVTV